MKKTIAEILKNRGKYCEKSDFYHIDKVYKNAEEKARTSKPLINSLTFSEKYNLALSTFTINFNYSAIKAFLKRCERQKLKNPNAPLSKIVELAEYGKGTGKNPSYDPRPKKSKPKKSKWGKLS